MSNNLLFNKGKVLILYIMRYLSQILPFVIVICIFSIQLVPLFDNPEHLKTPGPDCPICMVYETQVLIPNTDSIDQVLNLLTIILDFQPLGYNDHPIIAKFSIRAPPQFSLL